LTVVVGFILGCAVGAAGEAAAGLWALGLPTAIAFFAFRRLSARHR
jgi:MYXO-CTERM domain-containing protein